MRAHLQVAALVVALAIAASAGAVAAHRHWPDPPASWLHSTEMVCVRWRESQNGLTSRNIYEMEGPRATAADGDYEWLYDAPRAEQDYLAWQLWRRSGCHQPWGQYDGCC